MSNPTPGMFTKLIVDDEEKMTDYYTSVYRLNAAVRVDGNSVGTGESFREVILTQGADMSSGTLVMFKFTDRPAPRDQQVILGFVTDDMDALKARIVANGGALVGSTRDEVSHGVRVQFSQDPEGALAENVQMLAH
ncbi:VOC family protein [Sphingopyxis yananensis]|uniref:VOC family protein n=1 Tax=Sphingopyxis yananensis TaxID=2886687 RepID=UPI001D106474|nr:VOC family protein [Sphingopyxis yananensis]MCC2603133.1 bleomycin resistance protein [Sphingopyxis yananensis]